MPKRKHHRREKSKSRRSSSSSSSSPDRSHLLKKLKKLEKKIKKVSSRDDRSSSSSSDRNPRGSTRDKERPKVHSSHRSRNMASSDESDRDNPHSHDPSNSNPTDSAETAKRFTPSGRREPTVSLSKSRSRSPAEKDDILEIDIPLDDEFLKLLGDTPNTVVDVGPNIHKDLIPRWTKILKEGLDKDAKANLMNKYPVNGNCVTLKAPILNPKIAATMSDVAKKKDNFQFSAQSQLGAGISAVGSALSSLLNGKSKDESQLQLIAWLSDASRLLTDLHHSRSITWRSFLTPSFNKGNVCP